MVVFAAISVLALTVSCTQAPNEKAELPNFIIILTDDMGYGDLGSNGATHLQTPHLDEMAQEGIRLTDFYVAAPICTPSRAALLTGSYPKRISISKVFLAADPEGLAPEEVTIAEVLKEKDYRTALFGKWHLGDQPEFLPTRQGFDEFFGLPYSHDIHPLHPNNARHNFPDLPLMEGEEVIELNPNSGTLTQRITERAVRFIETNKEKPFFLYMPHFLPHRPVYASSETMVSASQELKDQLSAAESDGSVASRLRDQLYDLAIKDIDDSVGAIRRVLKENGLAENTFILFTSDNGPAIGGLGSTAELRGRKGSTYEGGMRMPTVAVWPGQISSGTTSHEIFSTMDLLPTFAYLADIPISGDREIDGKNIWSVLGPDKHLNSPHSEFYYYSRNELQAVRAGEWKLFERDGEIELYNLHSDISESNNLMNEHPEVVDRLVSKMTEQRRILGHGDHIACEICRPAGRVENPRYLTIKE